MYGQLLGGDVKRRVSAARLDRFVPVPEAMHSGNRLDLFGAVNEGLGFRGSDCEGRWRRAVARTRGAVAHDRGA
jgi:hypothetical protein